MKRSGGFSDKAIQRSLIRNIENLGLVASFADTLFY